MKISNLISERIALSAIIGIVGLGLVAVISGFSVKLDLKNGDTEIKLETYPARSNPTNGIFSQPCANQKTDDPHQQNQDRLLPQSNRQGPPQSPSCKF